MFLRTKLGLVKFFPQVQFNTQFARQLTFEKEAEEIVTDIALLRKRLDYRFWRAMTAKDWEQWESVAQMYARHALPMDEVSWTILIHGYLMSHRHSSANALLVLKGSMSIHPAIVQLNESLVTSFFQLSDIGIKSSLNGWQNIAKLAWMSAARLRSKRAGRVKTLLQGMTAQEVMKIGPNEVANLMLSDIPKSIA